MQIPEAQISDLIRMLTFQFQKSGCQDTDHVFVELDVRETSIDKIEWRSVFTVMGYNIFDPRQK